MNGKTYIYFMALCLIIIGLVTKASAQTGNDIWGAPQNLSRSGAAADPQVVVDATGLFHVLWLDTFDGFVYTQGNGEEWTSPEVVELPFGTRRYFPEIRQDQATPFFIPRLVSSVWGLHAFWRDEEGALFSSSVSPGGFGDFNAWLAPRRLSEAAAAFDIVSDADGQLHLVIVRTAHSELYPAGVYYTRSVDGGSAWSVPVPLYQSIYFRLLEEDNVGVSIVSGADGRLHVAWDDSRQRKILYIQSPDNGSSWGDVKTAVSRSSDELWLEGENQEAAVDLLAASLTETLLFWRIGNDEECELYVQLSTDFGENWTGGKSVPDADRCSDIKSIWRNENGGVLIHAGGNGGDRLIGWQDGGWTNSRVLPPGFIEPERGTKVQMGCIQVAEGYQGRLLVVGCDLAGGNEIWAMVQSQNIQQEDILNSPISMPSSPWTVPEEISSNLKGAQYPAVAADSTGRFHLVWSQPEENDLDGPGKALYYTRLETTGRTSSIPIFAYDGEKAEQPAMAIDSHDLLHLVWSGGEAGEIYYSRVKCEQAIVTGMWAERMVLPMRGTVWSSPDIRVGQDDAIHVVYAAPVNNRRGIYYTRSDDGGKHWIGPMVIFDAASAGWAMVDHPSLAIGADGTIHAAWSRLPLAGSLLPGGIFYARSTDGGETWSDIFEVTKNKTDWPQLVAVGGMEVHLTWEELSTSPPGSQRWHCWSADSGFNWSDLSKIPTLEGIDGPLGKGIDGAGRVHLAAVGRYLREEDPYRRDIPVWLPVQHLMWADGRWDHVPSGSIAAMKGDNNGLSLHAAVAIAFGDQIGLVFRAPGGAGTGSIYFMMRQSLELPEIQLTPLPTLTPVLVPTEIPTATPLPMPTPVPDFGNETDLQLDGIGAGSEYFGLVAGIIPAGLIVLGVLVVGVWLFRRGLRIR